MKIVVTSGVFLFYYIFLTKNWEMQTTNKMGSANKFAIISVQLYLFLTILLFLISAILHKSIGDHEVNACTACFIEIKEKKDKISTDRSLMMIDFLVYNIIDQSQCFSYTAITL